MRGKEGEKAWPIQLDTSGEDERRENALSISR